MTVRSWGALVSGGYVPIAVGSLVVGEVPDLSRLAGVEARQSRLVNAQVTYMQLEFVENGERLGAIPSMCLPNQRWRDVPNTPETSLHAAAELSVPDAYLSALR